MAAEKKENWSIFGIRVDPLCGQTYNLIAVENSA